MDAAQSHCAESPLCHARSSALPTPKQQSILNDAYSFVFKNLGIILLHSRESGSSFPSLSVLYLKKRNQDAISVRGGVNKYVNIVSIFSR